MNCTETRSLFCLYLDGAVTGRQMCEISEHLRACPSCTAEYGLLKQTQKAMTSLGRRPAPNNLALKIRVAISREAAKQQRPRFEGALTRLDNALKGFMVPATAGVLSAVVFFGLLIGFFALPQPLQADRDFYSPPELKALPFGFELSSLDADSIVVEVYVDQNGRVQDHKILSVPEDAKNVIPQLNNMLIFTQFRPATSFGQPVSGPAVLSFSKVNVKG